MDDIAILGEDLNIIKRFGNKLINTAKIVGLTVNDDKTKYLVVGRSNRNYRQEQHIEIEEFQKSVTI